MSSVQHVSKWADLSSPENSSPVCDLCRSQLFYYSAGISIGMLASLLILIYMMSKVMPKVRVPVWSGNGGGIDHSVTGWFKDSGIS